MWRDCWHWPPLRPQIRPKRPGRAIIRPYDGRVNMTSRRVLDPMRIPMTWVMSRLPPGRPGSLTERMMRKWSAANIWIYRRTGGRVAGHIGNADLLILRHVGRRTGAEYAHPLLYIPDGDNLVIAASLGGATKDPVWYGNLKAAGSGLVEIGRRRVRVTARKALPDEAARLWPQLDRAYPPFVRYRDRAQGHREIPPIILTPVPN